MVRDGSVQLTEQPRATLCAPRVTSLALVSAPSPTEAALAQLHDLRTALAETVELADAQSAVKRADAIRQWVRVARLRGQVAVEAGELHVRAQRGCGELLLEHIATAGTTT